jgi:hypothetical protein
MQRFSFQNRTGEIVIAEVGGLFYHANINVRLLRFELYRARQSRWPRANYQNLHLVVIFIV